jgi:hypothetical protein
MPERNVPRFPAPPREADAPAKGAVCRAAGAGRWVAVNDFRRGHGLCRRPMLLGGTTVTGSVPSFLSFLAWQGPS